MGPPDINMATLAALFRQEMQLCNVKKDETLAIVSDLNSRRDYVAAAFAAASELGANIYEMCVNSMPSWTKMGVETIGQNKGTLEALCKADMIIMLHIPLFTKWLKVVRDAGARVLLVIDAPQMLQPLLSQPGLKEATVHAGNRLGSAKEMRVLSPAGTDLRVSLGEYPVMVQYGFAESPGRYDRWGGGIVHTFPNEGTSNGTVVVQPGDIVILPYCRYVQDEIRIEVRDGFIRKIEGSLDAKLMNNWLEDNKRSPDDMDGHAISHLGWGVNPNARWDNLALLGNHDLSLHTGSSRVFAGNFLFSTGPNTQGGGKRNTKGHYDIPMLDCTVLLDNDVIIERGKVVDPKMIVERTQ